jgi:predicted nuclease of predicted toxin-antitoxin system
MRCVVDENIPPTAVRRLRELGHDVLSVKESMTGFSDVEVLARAVAEMRVVVTFDKDFGELAFRSRLPTGCGVILLRLTQRGREQDISKIVEALNARDDWAGAFWTVTDRRLRRRPLLKSTGRD